MTPNPPDIARFNKWYIYHALRHKKIVSVDLNDPNYGEEDKLYRFRQLKKLDFISNEIARRQFTHDTGSVLKVQLGEKCTYGDFVWVLNQAKVYDMKRYAFVDDAYFLFTNPPPEPVEDLRLDLGVANDVVYEPPVEKKPSWWATFKRNTAEWWETTAYIIKRSYVYLAGFLLLILVPAVIGLRKKTPLKTKKTAILR